MFGGEIERDFQSDLAIFYAIVLDTSQPLSCMSYAMVHNSKFDAWLYDLQ